MISAAQEPKFGNRDSVAEAGKSKAKQESEIQMEDGETVLRQKENVGVIQPSSVCNQGAFQYRQNGEQLETGNIADKAMGKLKQRVSDVVSHKKNILLLQTKIQALIEAVAEVEPLLSSGGNDPEDGVHEWFANASNILQDSNGILEGRSNMVDRKRLCSTCLDPTASWETGEMLREVEKILDDKQKLDLASYSCGLFYCNKLQSREDKLQKILEALMDIDTDLIGIAGMVGVGKTVLARELARRAPDNQLFDYTVMVQVSESFDVKSMQSQISKRIGLELSESDDEETRARHLSNVLEQKIKKRGQEGETESVEQSKILVIIDGLQHVIDLVKVGITVKSTQKRKVVLLSRNSDICKKMGAKKFLAVECLDLADSKFLFRESLKDKMQSMEITLGKYEYLENVMVMKCGGLPLMISSLASVLRSMRWYDWESLADKLLRHTFLEIDEVKEVPSAILELCNNFIRKGNEHKLFLRLCCLILGQGVDLPLAKLMRYGIGFGLFADGSFTPFEDWVHELKTLSLLLETTPQHVKIHDIIHTVGFSALSQDENNRPIILHVGNSSHTRESYENCVAISMTSDLHESLDGLELNKLQAFCLTDIDEFTGRLLSIPDNFFQGMKNLNVLEISCRRIIKVPSSIQALQNLITLHLENCDIKGEIISMICNLDKLQVLSMRGSRIEVIPEEIVKLTNLRVLELNRYTGLGIFPVDAVAKMVRLKEFYLNDESLDWKTYNIENLNSTTDEISSDTSNFANLTRFNIYIGIQDWDYWGLEDMISHFSRALIINDCTVPRLVKSSLRELLPQTEILHINQLKGSTNGIGEFCKDVFSHLKRLHIVRCDLKRISEESRDVFPELEILILRELHDLTSICCWEEAVYNCFPQLKELRLKMLSMLAPYALPAQIAVGLRIMEVARCFSLRYIFPTDDTDGADLSLEFPNMEVLELTDLPRLQALVQPSKDSMKTDERPFLFNVKVKLPSLKIIWLERLELIENLWDLSGRSPEFGNLKSITISRCIKLNTLFSSPINSLLQLETIRVEYCSEIRDVITEDDANHTNMMTFPRLRTLVLVGLTNLQCFYRGPHLLKFPMLKQLELGKLGEFKAFTLSVLESQQAVLQHSSDVNLSSVETMSLYCVGRMMNLCDLSAGSTNFAAHEPPQISQSYVKSPLFGNLKVLTVSDCFHLESLFPCRIVSSLLQLETLEVHTCYSMKEVITSSTADVEHDANTMITFPRLRVLLLYNMASLECFYRGLHFLKLPMLKELHLTDLEKMKAFTLPRTQSVETEGAIFLDDEIDLSSLEHLQVKCTSIELLENTADKVVLFSLKKLELHNLKELKMIRWNMLPNLQSLIISEVNQYHHWTSLISCSLLIGGGVLARLEYMKIENCSSLETIISREELRQGEDQDFIKYGITLFPSLKEIHLSQLPRLESFSMGSYEAHFPSLETVKILGCDSLQSFPTGCVRAPMLKSVEWNGRPIEVAEFDDLNSMRPAAVQPAEKREDKKLWKSPVSTYESNESSLSLQKQMKASSGGEDDKNKMQRKEIERQRRQEMSALYSSLRSLLPLDYVKGKRSTSDHIAESTKYIKQLEGRIKELGDTRDKLRSESSSSSSMINHVRVTTVTAVNKVEVFLLGSTGLQVLITCREDAPLLSTILRVLLQAGLDVISSVTNRLAGGALLRNIHCQLVTDVAWGETDVQQLQHKLYQILSSNYTKTSTP